MKLWFFTLAIAFFGSVSQAQEIPRLPGTGCPTCTPKMKNILDRFHATPHAVSFTSQVYSGNCYFLSSSYGPHQAHRSVVLIDQHPTEDRFYFATGFTFFGASDTYANLTLEQMRERAQGAWNRYGPIEVQENATRIVTYYDNGFPAFLYFLRQDPVTRELIYITFWGGSQVSFCELSPNP